MTASAVQVPLAPKSSKRWGLRVARWLLAAFAVVVLVFGLAVFNNNYSIGTPSRAEFSAQLDRAIANSTQWILQHPENYGNPSVMFMVGDMARMSADPRLEQYGLSGQQSGAPSRPAHHLVFCADGCSHNTGTVAVRRQCACRL